ncbi:MAG: flagellar export protein FliJ [Sulfurimonas sp.]|uniref:flagellar export protein FliJ n=1 Tax=Sulfurimonas sp. TaxID=2022749 RepID=UPI0026258530|nr:flagellar export protein FliJ [Sulfurimonas sp.]MDD2652990.1 flagellar export protein FliJ [Sulfurimonas sp.]MDD3452436.1 flagellar export protein FliJ [Sulfurimonas sp.]
MKSRFSPLVKVKKNLLQKSERFLQKATVNLNSASSALELSYNTLKDITPPSRGTMSQMLASRTLLSSQRELIKHNQEWVAFAKNQVEQARVQLKTDMIELEKFQYLELQEIKQELKKKAMLEAKNLDEVALMAYMGKNG